MADEETNIEKVEGDVVQEDDGDDEGNGEESSE